MQLGFSECIASAKQELVVEMATSSQSVLEAKRLRYRVYCEERGYEAGQNGLEEDEFDASAKHVLVRSRATGAVFGTVRVALANAEQGVLDFPMERVCQNGLLAPLPRHATGEVSRFALLRDRSAISPAAAALMRLCLIQGVIQVCGEHQLTHLCAMMEKTLLRLLGATAIHFQPVGPAIEYRGLRQPSIWQIDEGLSRAQRENPAVWSFISMHPARSSPGGYVHHSRRTAVASHPHHLPGALPAGSINPFQNAGRQGRSGAKMTAPL
jgi:N-acyl-L-homoserine lactone synthetase